MSKRNWLLGTVAAMMTTCVLAQGGPDTTRIILNDREVIVGEDASDYQKEDKWKKHKFKKPYRYFPLSAMAHWAGIEFGVNGYYGGNTSINLPSESNALDLNYGKSWFVNINILEGRFDLYEHWLGLVTGLGFNINTYALNRQVIINQTPDSTYMTFDTVNNFRKNRLKATYLTIPLLLEFNSNKKASKSFHVNVGVIGGLRISSRTKVVYNVGGVKNTHYQKSDFNLNAWKATATIRAGYAGFSAMFNWTFTELFKRGKWETLYPFEIGVALHFK